MDNNQSKVVIITGASGGIGKVIAQFLVTKDYIVYVLSRQNINDQKINYLKCDITDYELVKQLVKQIYNKHKRIDLVINNSGYGINSSVVEMDIKKYYDLLNVNVFAALNLSLNSIEYLKKTNGKILNLGSVVSEIILPFNGFYSISKQLLKLSSLDLADEFQNQVYISYLILGKVKTDFDKHRYININQNSVYFNLLTNSIKNLKNTQKYGLKPIKIAQKIYKLDQKNNIKPIIKIGILNKFILFCFNLLTEKIKIKLNYYWFIKKNK